MSGVREIWYQLQFRVGMLRAALYAAFITLLFGSFALSFPTPIALPFQENAEFGVGLLTFLALAGALLNHLAGAVGRRRISRLDMCTSGFLARQVSVLLVAAQFDRHVAEWPLPGATGQPSTFRAVLLFFPGLAVLSVVSLLLLVPCIAMWLWVFVSGRVPGRWTRAMRPVVSWMDRFAYRILMGTERDWAPLDLQPPRFLRQSSAPQAAADAPGRDDEALSPGQPMVF